MISANMVINSNALDNIKKEFVASILILMCAIY